MDTWGTFKFSILILDPSIQIHILRNFQYSSLIQIH